LQSDRKKFNYSPGEPGYAAEGGVKKNLPGRGLGLCVFPRVDRHRGRWLHRKKTDHSEEYRALTVREFTHSEKQAGTIERGGGQASVIGGLSGIGTQKVIFPGSYGLKTRTTPTKKLNLHPLEYISWEKSAEGRRGLLPGSLGVQKSCKRSTVSGTVARERKGLPM